MNISARSARIGHLATAIIVLAVAGMALPAPARPREFGEVRYGHPERVVKLRIDERSWLSYGPGRVSGYIGHPGVVERPAGFQWHPGAIVLGGW